MASPKKRARKSTRKTASTSSRLKPFFIGALFGLLIAVAGYLLLTRHEGSLNLFPKQSNPEDNSPSRQATQPKPTAPNRPAPAPQPPKPAPSASTQAGTQTPATPAAPVTPSRPSQPPPAPSRSAEPPKTATKPAAPAAGKTAPETKSQSASRSQQDEIGKFLNQNAGSGSKPKHTPTDSKSQSSRDDLGDLIGFVSTDNSNDSVTSSDKQPPSKTTSATQSRDADGANPKFLQAGVFHSTQEAENFRVRLLMDGFDPVQIQSTTLKGKPASKVLIGPFTSQATLDDAAARLKKNNIRFQVISR